MVSLAGSTAGRLGIGIVVNTVGDAQTLTGLDIVNKPLIHLAGLVLTEAAADDGEVDLGSHSVPVDLALVLTDVNTESGLVAGISSHGHNAGFQFVGRQQVAIGIAPAVFLAGISQGHFCRGLGGGGNDAGQAQADGQEESK